MKINYTDFVKIMTDKLERSGGVSEHIMLKGDIMRLCLSESADGIMNDRYKKLNCEFKILYAIYEKAVSLGGEMWLGASAAQNGKKVGSEDLPVDTIDGFITLEFYGGRLGDKTLRRSTYYAAILDWAGLVTNHWGGYITVKNRFME